MADNSMMDSVLGWLKGSPAATPAPEPWIAPPLASYPSNDDAEFARKAGFSQGSINQPFLDNQTAKVMGKNFPVSQVFSVPPPSKGKQVQRSTSGQPAPVAENIFMPKPAFGLDDIQMAKAVDDPKLSQRVDLSNPSNGRLKGDLSNIMMRAGLAANRVPVAAVGFDPERIALDPAAGSNVNLSGVTLSDRERGYPMYGNSNYPSVIVHESAHRGMNKLDDLYPDKMREIRKNLPSDEMVVRFLMQSQAGDPEAQYTGEEGQKQRRNAVNMMDTTLYPNMAKGYRGAIDQMNELAIDAMKNRGKRAGPQ